MFPIQALRMRNPSAIVTPSFPGTGGAANENYDDVVQLLDFQEANGATSGSDGSSRGFGWTAVGNANVQSNRISLDGVGDYLTLASDADDWDFLHNGATWTMEFTVKGRPTNTTNTILDTTGGASANRGAFIAITSTGALRVLLTRSVNGAAMIDYTSTWAVANDGADHHIVIEWDWGTAPAGTSNALRVGMDGTRQALVARNNNNGFNASDASFDMLVGRANGSTSLDYHGQFTGLRIHRHRLIYDLLNNSTYTVPIRPYPTSGTNDLKEFPARHFPNEEGPAAGWTLGLNYRAEPRIIAGSTAGTFYCFAMVGSANFGTTDTVIIKLTSTNYGRTWSLPTTIASDATYACRNHAVGVASDGTIIVTYRKSDTSNVSHGTFYRTSADNYATETAITSLLTSASVPFGKAVQTANGLMFTFYWVNFAEVLFWNGSSFSGRATLYDVTATTPGYNEPYAFSDGSNKVVWVVRRDGAGNNDYAFYKSTDGGATATFLEEVQWTATTFDEACPAALGLVGGNVLCVWSSRSSDYKLKYTISSANAFWADPGRMMDGTITINTLRQMRNISSPSGSDFGYPDICPLTAWLCLVANYERTNTLSTSSRLFVQTFRVS